MRARTFKIRKAREESFISGITTYVARLVGNRYRVMAIRGEIAVAVTASMATEEEAQATAERLTARHQELNPR